MKPIETQEPGIIIGAAAADVDSAISSVTVDPRAIARAAIARIAALTYPTPERERDAAAMLRSHRSLLVEMIGAFDLSGLNMRLDEIERKAFELARPIRQVSFEDSIRAAYRAFNDASWTTEEIDALKSLWRDGDRITGIGVSSVTLGDRTVARSEVREKLRNFMTNARLNEMARREKEALELEAENGRRSARGEGVHHRQW